jgi:hypothetical protein
VVFILAPSVALTALAYVRLADLFANPHVVEQMTLDDLKARTAHALSGSPFRAAAQKLASAIGARETWHRRPVWRLGERESLLVQHNGQTGIVVNVRISALEQGVALIDSRGPSAQSGPSAKGFELPVPTEIAIHVSPGERVHHRSVLLEVFLPGIDLSREEADNLRSVFHNAFVVSSTATDPVELLEGDLATLQDSIIRALRDRQLSRVRRGYQYYDEVIRDAGGGAGLGWRWLDRQAWEIDDVAVEGGGRTSMLSIEAAASRFMDAVARRDATTMTSALQAYTHVWERLLLVSGKEGKYAKEYLLVSLQNHTEFYVPAQSQGGEPNVEAAARCVWTFVELAKTAIDVDASEDADRVLGYLSGLFRYGRDEYASARRHVYAGLLVLGAWVLYLRTERGELKGNMRRLVALLRGGPIVESLQMLETRDDYLGRWRFWETEESLPLEASVLSLENFVLQAGLLGLREQSAMTFANDEVASLGERLLDQIDALRRAWPVDVELGDGLAGLESKLRDALSAHKRVVDAMLAEQKLDSRKIEAFLERFEDALSSPRRLSDLFSGAAVSDGAVESDPRILFLNLVVPKIFLAQQSRVYADPEALASSMAGAMVRGEDRGVLEQCRSVGASRRVELEGVVAAATEVVTRMSRPLVVLMNSGEVIDRLATSYEALSVRLGELEVPAFALYGIESDEQVLIVDLDAGPALRREAELKEGLNEIPGTGIAVGIFDDVPWDPAGPEEPRVRIETGEKMKWLLPTGLAAHFFFVHDAEW